MHAVCNGAPADEDRLAALHSAAHTAAEAAFAKHAKPSEPHFAPFHEVAVPAQQDPPIGRPIDPFALPARPDWRVCARLPLVSRLKAPRHSRRLHVGLQRARAPRPSCTTPFPAASRSLVGAASQAMKAAVAAAFDALRKANHENSRRACAQFLKAAATATDLAHVLGMYEAEMSGPVSAHCAF
jgi:hypothetical protein